MILHPYMSDIASGLMFVIPVPSVLHFRLFVNNSEKCGEFLGTISRRTIPQLAKQCCDVETPQAVLPANQLSTVINYESGNEVHGTTMAKPLKPQFGESASVQELDNAIKKNTKKSTNWGSIWKNDFLVQVKSPDVHCPKLG